MGLNSQATHRMGGRLLIRQVCRSDQTKFSAPAVTAHALWKEVNRYVGIPQPTPGVRIRTQRVIGERRSYQITRSPHVDSYAFSTTGVRKSEKKILPADVDGYIQGIRLSLDEQDAKYVHKPPAEGKYVRKSPRPNGKEKDKAIGVNRLASNETPSVSQ